MATTIYPSITPGQGYIHHYTPGPKPKPKEMLDKRVNITLSPQAHEHGIEMARAAGMSFSAWVEEQIRTLYTRNLVNS